MLKIALGHKAQVGKDTFFEIASSIISAVNIKFSNDVCEGMIALQRLYNLPTIKDRKLLQIIENHFREEYSQDFWISKTLKKIKNNSNNIIITDVRYQNEFDKLKDLGFILIKINRPENTTHKEDTVCVLDNNLINESRWDFVIENNKGLKEYEDKVIEIINLIKTKTLLN